MAMEQRRLGATGVDVTRVILGCGNFGGVGSAPAFFGQGESEEQAFALMDAAWESGVRAFDTADAYGGGRSETCIGRWLAARGHRPVLATKVFNSVTGDPSDRGLARERILRQIEGSLERLGVERVDLYLIHAPDPDTPLPETLGAFDELVRAGKVGAIGASNVDRAYLEDALEISEREGICRFEWVQNSYSLLDREPEAGVLPFCAEYGLGFTPFGPLAGGWLTGKYERGQAYPAGSRMTLRPEPYAEFDDERVWRGLDRLRAAAAERCVDMATLAFAWLFSNPEVTAIVVGPRRPEHLEPARRALEVELSPHDRAELAEFFQPL
jgi:aryl-alcohol dehydrogenase-like predicted oxidoreductase